MTRASMWIPTPRRQHSHAGLRYGSDLTDSEWAILEPLLRVPAVTGRKRVWPMREIVNAMFYILRGGVAWRLLPCNFPPWWTAYRGFARFRDDGVWENVNHMLVMLDREHAGREASPTAAVIDSQSVKTSESGGVRGYDAGKKTKGRKRHALVDTDGRALTLAVMLRRGRAWPRQSQLGLRFLVRNKPPRFSVGRSFWPVTGSRNRQGRGHGRRRFVSIEGVCQNYKVMLTFGVQKD